MQAFSEGNNDYLIQHVTMTASFNSRRLLPFLENDNDSLIQQSTIPAFLQKATMKALFSG
jgi:hypothetical protein